MEKENRAIDAEMHRIQAADDLYLAAHPDPYAGVDFRTARVKCPTCGALIPYRGCAFHEHFTDDDMMHAERFLYTE